MVRGVPKATEEEKAFQRTQSVDAAVRAIHSRRSASRTAGTTAVCFKRDLLAIASPEELGLLSTQQRLARSLKEKEWPFVPNPKRVKTRPIRQGAHVGPLLHDPYDAPRMDPVALKIMKVKDPVGYDVYCKHRPWTTQSQTVGELVNKSGSGPERVPRPSSLAGTRTSFMSTTNGMATTATGTDSRPATVGGGVGLRDTVLGLRAAASGRSFCSQEYLEAVSPTREGYIAAPARQEGDMTTQMKGSFVNPATLPEMPFVIRKHERDRTLMSHHPTDTEARDAIENIKSPEGTLVAEKPDLVSPLVWKRLVHREKTLSVGPDVHAHKRRPPGSFGGSLTQSILTKSS